VLGFVDEPLKQLHKKISLKEQLEEALAEIGRDDPQEGRGFEQEPEDRDLSGAAVLRSTF
jgi:hypothetical protein